MQFHFEDDDFGVRPSSAYLADSDGIGDADLLALEELSPEVTLERTNVVLTVAGFQASASALADGSVEIELVNPEQCARCQAIEAWTAIYIPQERANACASPDTVGRLVRRAIALARLAPEQHFFWLNEV